MSDDRLGRVHLDSKGLSSFKPAIASLDCGFVFQIWQLIHSVQIIHAAVSIRAAACGAVMPEPGGLRIQGAEKRFAGVRSF